MSMKDEEVSEVPQFVKNMVRKHHNLFENALPMIASENLISPLAREMLLADFMDRYAEGHPGERYYQGNEYVDEVERKCIELAKYLFKAPYADVRPISGTVANLAVLFALAKPGDKVMACSVSDGAHISTAEFGAVGVRGCATIFFPWDVENMNIDVDKAAKAIRSYRPRLALFGRSVFLFPSPIRELKEALDDVESIIWYDGAHVMGLIAHGRFQDPLREGADIITGSTHKTLPGPQHGIILAEPKTQAIPHDKMLRKLDFGVFPGVVSNHHLHTLPSLAIALAECIKYGAEYADQIIKNAKALGQALYERGFDVLCEHLGFTESHTLAMDVKKLGGATKLVEDLEKANIITNKNLMPWDDVDDALNPSGIRLGVQELTRVGMREGEMEEVAELFKNVCIDKMDLKKVREKVIALKSEFKKVHYCFKEGVEAYKFYEII
jgi:glycine hydroxymethyltransferase